MNRSHQGQPHEPESMSSAAPLVVPLETLDRTSLPVAGGKAANLGELIRAGFAVPAGFCVTTAAYVRASAAASLDTYLSALEATESSDSARLIELATAICTGLCQTPLPPEVIEAVTSAYQALSPGDPIPVSVRSSATAEDLPEASFAGQEETEVAGVLFTANPLTGKRRQAVIDANPGLGEAVVSGATNPDHFVVQTTTGEIVERRLGDKQVLIQAAAGGGIQKIEAGASPTSACLSDEQIRALAALGARVEALYETPQDIEWTIDPSGQMFLLQARPITTLFPLPAEAPSTDESLRVYLAFGVQQGTYRPFTPMGLSALRLLASGFLTLIGFPPADPLAGPRFVAEAASRPFCEVTAALRSPFGRRFLMEAMAEAAVHAATCCPALVPDQRPSLSKSPRQTFVRAPVPLLTRTRLPWYLL